MCSLLAAVNDYPVSACAILVPLRFIIISLLLLLLLSGYGLCWNLYRQTLNERGSSRSYDLHNDCLKQLSGCASNKLRETVTERAFHILIVRMKKYLWHVVVIHFWGTNRVTFVLLLDLVALERMHLVGITVGSTLTSPVTDLLFLCLQYSSQEESDFQGVS